MFIRKNEHRNGFTPPPMPEYMTHQFEDVAYMVRATVREAFGIAGLRAWDDLNPTFVEDMTATLLAVRTEGAWDQHVEEATERSREAWAGVGRTLKALLDSKPSDTPKDIALRALGANANIDPDHIDTLIGEE